MRNQNKISRSTEKADKSYLNEFPLILTLDGAGNPLDWIDYEKASYYSTKNLINYVLSEQEITLRGGTNSKTGQRSKLNLSTIIAIKGAKITKRSQSAPKPSGKILFRRDGNQCAYCGNHFNHSDLTMDHIMPSSRGGRDTWINLITSCKRCNAKKDDKTPEEAGMPLLYDPYTPSRAEYLLMRNFKRVLEDQREFLAKRLNKNSRILTSEKVT